MSDWLEALVTPAATAPGWYGKLLALGDFAQRRLPAEVAARLDGWLAEAMRSSRQALGEGWLDTYLRCPLWQFAFGADVLDGSCWAGVLMPSVDAVGRYFPLVALRALPGLPASDAALWALDGWYTSLAQATLDTLGARLDVDAFEERLAALPPLPADLGFTAMQGDGGSMRWVVAERGIAGAWPPMAEAASRRLLAGRSLWWPYRTRGEGAEPIRACLEQSLPEADRFVALLRDEL